MSVNLHTLILAFFVGLLLSGCSDRNISTSLLRSITAQQKTCPSGEYLVDATAGTCAPAGAGYYSPPSSNDRFPCAAGRYCSTDQNTSPEGDGACAGGRFCPAGSTDAQGAGLCQAGHACPAGSTTSTGSGACLGGTYAGAGQAACTACTSNIANARAVAFDVTESGLTTNSCQVTAVTQCQAGFAVNSDNMSCRTQCASGTYWLAGTCQPIPKDYYAGANDSTIVACPANSETTSTGSLDSNSCLGHEGYYSCNTGTCLDTRTDSDNSTYSPPLSNALLACSPGYACGTGLEVACGTGTYAATTGSASCLSCSPPQHSSGVVFAASSALTSDSCPVVSIASCETGFTVDGTNKACRAKCAAGTYFETTNSTCQTIPAGSYTILGTDTKAECPWGSTSNAGNTVNGLGACYNKAGYQCTNLTGDNSTANCLPAPGGKYATVNDMSGGGNSTVHDCTAGYDCPQQACSDPKNASSCPAGASSPTGNGHCGPGTYSTTGTACQACTNRPLHAASFSYDWTFTTPTTTPTSCPINVVTACDSGWVPTADSKACETSNPCWQSTAPNPGASCGDDTTYVGEITRSSKKFRMMISKARCSITSGTTTCLGGTDNASVNYPYLNAAGGTAGVLVDSQDNGAANTVALASAGTNYQAAHFCSDLTTGGPGPYYSDWFLPAKLQLQAFMNMNSSYRTAVGLQNTYYWSSTGIDTLKGYNLDISDGSFAQISLTSSALVRCMREVEVE